MSITSNDLEPTALALREIRRLLVRMAEDVVELKAMLARLDREAAESECR